VTAGEKTKSFPIIDIAGPAEERGQQYGIKALPLIERSLYNYKNAYANEGISWEQACQTVAHFIPLLEKTEQKLLSEIRGIATSVNVRIEEILALNCRTEVLYGNKTDVNEPTDGCTGAIALPSASASGNTLHGQNWDWRDECAETSIILRITPETGPRILTQTEAGNLARCGMNTAGIALTGNFLKCDRDNKPGGIPIPFVRRHILEQTVYSDAIGVAYKAQKSFSTNLMISHADGEAIDLETVPGETFWIQSENGLLVHANHFESFSALARVRDESLHVAPCSLHRSRRVRDYLKPLIGQLTLEHFKQAFSDKFDTPSGVCAEPDNGPGGENSSTVATILMDVTQQKMWVAPRPYEEHTYTEYSFNS